MCECCAELADDFMCFFCDDMNKIHVNWDIAVSHYYQIHRFLPVEDCQINSDHDFPFRNSKINPSGYMLLIKPTTRSHIEWRLCCLRTRSFTRTTNRGSLHSEESWQGRSFSPPRSHNTDNFKTGKLHCLYRGVLSTGLCMSSTGQQGFIKQHWFIVMQLTWHFHYRMNWPWNRWFLPWWMEALTSILTIWRTCLSTGQLWHNLHLDCLRITCHAPGLSA